MKNPRTCEICVSQKQCLNGECPCELSGEFIAPPPRAVANALLLRHERLKLQARSELQQEMGQIKETLGRQVSVLAIRGAEKILQTQVDKAFHQKLLDQLSLEL